MNDNQKSVLPHPSYSDLQKYWQKVQLFFDSMKVGCKLA